MKWLELKVEVAPQDEEAVAELMRRFAPSGVAIEPEGEFEGGELRGNPVTIKAYLPLEEAPRLRRRLRAALGRLSLAGPRPVLGGRIVDEEDWAEAWKAYFPVHRLGRLVIKPPWRAYSPAADDLVIELDPGMAFGTGLHATTRLCARALERWLRPGMSVLDLGTGSGILAIAAARLGASFVLALDIDPVAVTVARANVEANGVSHQVAVFQGSLPWQGLEAFDLMVANISGQAIADLAPAMASVCDGILVVSGFLGSGADALRSCLLALGFSLLEEATEDDWAALVMGPSAPHLRP